MTVTQILLRVRTRKTCSLPQLKRYIKAVGLEPLGVRQRPQNYPDDSADRIFLHLGITPENGHAAGVDDGKALVSLAKLKKGSGKK